MPRPGLSKFPRLALLAALPFAVALSGCGSSEETTTTSDLPSDESRAVTIVRAAMADEPRGVDDFEYTATIADDGRTACVSGKARQGKELFGFSQEWVHWDVDLAEERIAKPGEEWAGSSAGLCDGTFATLGVFVAVSRLSDQDPEMQAEFDKRPQAVGAIFAAWRLDGQRLCLGSVRSGEVNPEAGFILASTTETGKGVTRDDSVSFSFDDPACTEPPAGTTPLVDRADLDDDDEDDATADACRSFPDMPGCGND